MTKFYSSQSRWSRRNEENVQVLEKICADDEKSSVKMQKPAKLPLTVILCVFLWLRDDQAFNYIKLILIVL